MGLVDYSSDDEDSSEDHKTSVKAPHPSLPPLPRAFHDLYAATVRTTLADDPSLHQGRHRAIPHVAGQWPSHLYIEWFPLPSEHARLSGLLASLREALQEGDDGASPFHSFLTSDLGAPLPLHISLSRPFVLTTADKARFLAQLVDRVTASGVARFDVTFAGLDWFRSPDSARAFLVLRAVVQDGGTRNEPLVTLLDRCNEQVTSVGQPALYARSSAGDDGVGDDAALDPSSFHVSVAWTLATNIDAWADVTQKVYDEWRNETAMTNDDPPLSMPVESIKAKIGNVVTDIPLRKASVSASTSASTTNTAAESGQRRSKRTRADASDTATERRRSKRSLFGL